MIRPLCLIATILLAANTHAASKNYQTQVTRTLSDANNYGGCMAKLVNPPSSAGLACAGDWVSFSCSGDFAERDVANRSFEIAQLAQLTQRSVMVFVDDAKKHNGFCFAPRIDLLNP